MKVNNIVTLLLFGAIHFLAVITARGQEFDSIPKTGQQQILFHSVSLNEDRTIWIHTPAEYNAATDRYPVLYLLDGGNHFKYASEMVDYLSGFETNYISKMIVVGIPNTERGRDFTPVFDSKATAAENGASRFLGFIEGELLPYIDKTYRTQPYRILEAHSLGGLFGTYAIGKSPALFQAVIIISPALTGDENKNKVMNDFASSLKRVPQQSRKFFVTLGNEGPQAVDLLTGHLKAYAPKTVKWSYKKYPDENHFSVPFKSIYDGLRFVYSNWHLEVFLNPQKIQYTDITAHFAKLSEEFGYTITPDEEFLNQCGYQQLNYKHMEQAIGIFKENIRLHPNSSNAYDSLGEAYMANGQKDLAIENYEKSVALNSKNENGVNMLKKLKGL